MKHKHHEVFEAAARGEAHQFEAKLNDWTHYGCAEAFLSNIYVCPDEWTVRRKQQTHIVNGWTVPAPMTEAPKDGGDYWAENSGSSSWAFRLTWGGTRSEQLCLKRGNCHATEQGAVMNCKARHGVDPFAEGEEA